jgi:N,N'-diacetyllegionaminate synthase
MRVGQFEVECQAPVFVIAEIGVNHDGSVDRARELVEMARACGADGVKVQVFSADALVHSSSDLAGYQRAHGSAVGFSVREMLRGYELALDEVGHVVRRVRELGMVPVATPFSVGDVAVIEALDLPVVKIASPDLVNRVLLKRAALSGKPMLVSTGASEMGEIERCVGWLRAWGVEFGLLHCVSSYPVGVDEAHLGWIGELRRFRAPVGYSDHTTDVMSGALAVAAGAVVVEKHLTYDRGAAGPDHAASAGPEEFGEYVRLIRLAERMRGRGGRRVLEIERDVRRVSRQSVVVRREIGAGEVIEPDDLCVQRPGTGICASRLDDLVGCRMMRAVEAGTMLRWEMVEGNDGIRMADDEATLQ